MGCCFLVFLLCCPVNRLENRAPQLSERFSTRSAAGKAERAGTGREKYVQNQTFLLSFGQNHGMM
jgi:hypothetical protein